MRKPTSQATVIAGGPGGLTGSVALQGAKLALDSSVAAVKVLIHLMSNAKRESVRKDAAMAIIALAMQAPEEEQEQAGVLRLVRDGDALAEARKRLEDDGHS